MSAVYRLLIFDRRYECRLDHHFVPLPEDRLSARESMQLVRGLCHSLRSMLARLAGGGTGRADAWSYRSSKYRLVYLEVASGWKFVLLMGIGMTLNLDNILKSFYATVFLEWIVNNPLIEPHSSTDLSSLGCFKLKMEEYFTRSLLL